MANPRLFEATIVSLYQTSVKDRHGQHMFEMVTSTGEKLRTAQNSEAPRILARLTHTTPFKARITVWTRGTVTKVIKL
mgnify:CR=1 FL=1